VQQNLALVTWDALIAVDVIFSNFKINSKYDVGFLLPETITWIQSIETMDNDW
jgi:hypothetical protein